MTAEPTAIPTREEYERALRPLAAEHDGVLYVRASAVTRKLGLPRGSFTVWERAGRLQRRSYAVPVSRSAPFGKLIAWRLAHVLDCLAVYRPEPRWTDEDDDALQDLLGVVPVAKIAERLGRTERAVQERVKRLGLDQRSAQGLYTTGQVARRAGVTPSTVQNWCFKRRPPLRFKRVPDRRRVKLIDPEDLAAFMREHPVIYRGLSARGRAQIERMAMPLHQRRKAVAA